VPVNPMEISCDKPLRLMISHADINACPQLSVGGKHIFSLQVEQLD